MNRIQSVITVTFAAVSITTAAFAADASKPVVPAPPVVANTQPAADAAVKNKSGKLSERNKKAKEASGPVRKTVAAPVAPAAPKNTAAPFAPATPAAIAPDSKKSGKLQKRNLKAKEYTKNMGSSEPTKTAPVAPTAK